MAPSRHPKPSHRGLDRVRDQILTALHFGRLHPGGRVPSVRRLADLTGMNRKTVHRAYRRLAREGLLDVRPGSGTFIAESNGRATTAPSTTDLLRSINRCRAEAARLGVPPAVFSEFIVNYVGGGLQELTVAAVECNREQIGVIADDLRAGLGVHAQPVLLNDLNVAPRRALGSSRGIVTTDCHWSEVLAAVKPLGLPVYRVALDPTFPQVLAHHAKHGPVLMIVRDTGFAPVFLRLLEQLGVPKEQIGRFTFLEPGEAPAALLKAAPEASVYVSPLVGETVSARLPHPLRRIRARWHVAPGSMDRLRARMSLDAATRAHSA